MKIGIITWFGGPNYGTNLQAVALQKYLRNQGNDVEIINFTPPKILKKESFLQKIVRQPDKYINSFISHKYKEQIESKNKKIKKFIKDNCVFTDLIEDDNSYIDICNYFDLIICGSDQIWNPNWYHRYYYADFPQIKTKKISYAPSLGVCNVEKENLKNIKSSLNSFAAISVREKQGANIIKDITGVNPEIVVDPTLLLKADEWSEFICDNKENNNGYIVSMFLTDNVNHWKAANRFAKKNKLKHIIIPYCGLSYLQKGTVKTNVGIEELLGLIKNAKYVLTDSFHITVFSIIFKKDFYTFMRFKEDPLKSQNSRIINLLNMTDLDYRIVSYNSKIIEENSSIDYESVNKKLENEIDYSKDFLLRNIR